MHVAALLPAYPPAARFGAPLATHRYLAHLVARGHTVSVGRLMGRGSGYALDGVEVARSAGVGFAAHLTADADVVVAHGGSPAGVRLARSSRHSVLFAHGHDAAGLDADLVACNSQTLRDHLVGAGRLPGPAIICRPPTDPEAHRVERTGDHVTIINLTRPKGVVTADAVARAMPDRRWLAVEGGYGRQERPRGPWWTYWPTQADMRAVWAETRILLMPSAFETWGMVGVEAMASGIPVIAHPTPGLRESLGGAGIFVDRDDTAGWVAAIEALDDPATYTAASTAARARSDELAGDVAADLDLFADSLEALVA